MDDIHTNVEMGQRCEQCGVVLSSTATLKRHQDTVHGEESYSCEQCGKKFNRKSNLNRHLEEVHGFERRVNLDFSAAEFILKFKCKECGKRFLAFKGTRKHLTMKRRRGSIVLCVGKLLAESSPSIGTLRFARKSLKLSHYF